MMVFLIGKVHGDLEGMPPGYALQTSELESLADQIPCAPVTFEHAGIQDIVRGSLIVDGDIQLDRVRQRLELLAQERPERGIVGSVMEMFRAGNNWYCMFTIRDDLPTVEWLVKTDRLRGLSLTHVCKDSGLVPLELSLCTEPARPGCWIVCVTDKPVDIVDYKRQLQQEVTEATVTMADTQASHLESIIKDLSPESQEAIKNRFVVVQAKLEAAQKQAEEFQQRMECEGNSDELSQAVTARKDAEEKLKLAEDNIRALEMVAASDSQRLRQEVSTLKAHIDPTILANCSVTDDSLESLFKTDNAGDIRRIMDRVLVAANTQMMHMKNNSLQQPSAPVNRKRKHVEITDNTSLLERALADTFEMA